MTIHLDSGGERGHDSDEEFFADYRANRKGSYFAIYSGPVSSQASFRVLVSVSAAGSNTTIHIETVERAHALRIIDVFESGREKYQLPLASKPKPLPLQPIVFLGHGRSAAWRELKDHLHEKHGFVIEAYEDRGTSWPCCPRHFGSDAKPLFDRFPCDDG